MAYDMGNMKKLMNKKTPIPMGGDEEVATMENNPDKSKGMTNIDKMRKHLESVTNSIEMAMEAGEIPQEKGVKLLEKATELFTVEPDPMISEEEGEEGITSYKPNKKRKKVGVAIKVGTVPQEAGVKGTPTM